MVGGLDPCVYSRVPTWSTDLSSCPNSYCCRLVKESLTSSCCCFQTKLWPKLLKIRLFLRRERQWQCSSNPAQPGVWWACSSSRDREIVSASFYALPLSKPTKQRSSNKPTPLDTICTGVCALLVVRIDGHIQLWKTNAENISFFCLLLLGNSLDLLKLSVHYACTYTSRVDK